MQIAATIQAGQNKLSVNYDLSEINSSDLSVKMTHQKENICLTFDVSEISIPELTKPCVSKKQNPKCQLNHCIFFNFNCQQKGIYFLEICLSGEAICQMYVNTI